MKASWSWDVSRVLTFQRLCYLTGIFLSALWVKERSTLFIRIVSGNANHYICLQTRSTGFECNYNTFLAWIFSYLYKYSARCTLITHPFLPPFFSPTASISPRFNYFSLFLVLPPGGALAPFITYRPKCLWGWFSHWGGHLCSPSFWTDTCRNCWALTLGVDGEGGGRILDSRSYRAFHAWSVELIC